MIGQVVSSAPKWIHKSSKFIDFVASLWTLWLRKLRHIQILTVHKVKFVQHISGLKGVFFFPFAHVQSFNQKKMCKKKNSHLYACAMFSMHNNHSNVTFESHE